MIEKVVITDAFFHIDGVAMLNPALRAYEPKLLGMKNKYIAAKVERSQAVTPLAWLAKQQNTSPATLLTSAAANLPQSYKQCWVASPYHARLTRSTLRIMPDVLLDRSEAVLKAICKALNPLLEEDGLQLHVVGLSLVLLSDKVWDVESIDFAQVSGGLMPDQLPKGVDAGHWMRLLSEVQMMLHQHQITTDSGLMIHGLWFWGKSEQASMATDELAQIKPIATRHAELQSVLQALDKERDATMIVSEAEHLPLLLQPDKPYPKQWLLLGDGLVVTCSANMLFRWLHGLKARKWKGMG